MSTRLEYLTARPRAPVSVRPIVTAKPVTPFKVNRWARFNQFLRPVNAPKLVFRDCPGDDSTCVILLDNRAVGTLCERSLDWFVMSPLSATPGCTSLSMRAPDVELVLARAVRERLDLGQALALEQQDPAFGV